MLSSPAISSRLEVPRAILLSRAQEQTRGVAHAGESQEQEVVAQAPDEGGDDETPNGALQKAQPRRLEALSLDHHAGFEGLNGDLNDLGGADQQANQDGGYPPQGFQKFRHGYDIAFA